MPRAIHDLQGQSFGRLVVESFAGMTADGAATWLTRCSCGVKKVVRGGHLTRGGTKSCGCLSREVSAALLGSRSRTHGMNDAPIRRIWTGMLQRCTNPNLRSYPGYGGRGITVCERWRKFENFYADMGDCPPGMSLDRKDNDGPYSPENCQWATATAQAGNRRSSRLVEHAGEKLCVSEWARRVGMNPMTLGDRLDRGWSIADALTRPLQQRTSKARDTHLSSR